MKVTLCDGCGKIAPVDPIGWTEQEDRAVGRVGGSDRLLCPGCYTKFREWFRVNRITEENLCVVGVAK